jgi:hypothetical protein
MCENKVQPYNSKDIKRTSKEERNKRKQINQKFWIIHCRVWFGLD